MVLHFWSCPAACVVWAYKYVARNALERPKYVRANSQTRLLNAAGTMTLYMQ